MLSFFVGCVVGWFTGMMTMMLLRELKREEINNGRCYITRYCKYTGNNKIIKNGKEIIWNAD